MSPSPWYGSVRTDTTHTESPSLDAIPRQLGDGTGTICAPFLVISDRDRIIGCHRFLSSRLQHRFYYVFTDPRDWFADTAIPKLLLPICYLINFDLLDYSHNPLI